MTRPAGSAESTAAKLRRRGFIPVLTPLLEILPVDAELPDPATLQAVLVTSQHALPRLPAMLRGLPLLAVGDATAAAARVRGHENVISASSNAQALAGLTAQRCNPAGSALLVASGAGQGHELADTLRALGFDVRHCSVYAARQVSALPEAASRALRAGTVYAATFFSAETARSFAALAESAGLRDTVAPVVALAIGLPAAAALACAAVAMCPGPRPDPLRTSCWPCL